MARRQPPLPAREEECDVIRSRNMAAIKSRGNLSTELQFLALLKSLGCTGWRRHIPIHGTPDFAFPKIKLAIFLDGCFWHGCPRCFKLPRSNVDYWARKIGRNVSRDRRNSRLLRAEGWSVLHVWEHALRGANDAVGKRVLRAIQKRELALGASTRPSRHAYKSSRRNDAARTACRSPRLVGLEWKCD